MSEPRTIREARIRAREIEAEINALRMSPAMAGLFAPWYLRDAQAKLRKFEREAAKYDDPRLPEMKPMNPQVERRAPLPGQERRRRFRCDGCLTETLDRPSEIAERPEHTTLERIAGGPNDGGWRRVVCGNWELVGRLPRGKASA